LAAAARGRGSIGRETVSKEDHARAINAYDNSLRQMDDTVRRIFDGLARKGYLDNAWSSFHQITVRPGRARHLLARHYLYPEFTRIPLFIYDMRAGAIRPSPWPARPTSPRPQWRRSACPCHRPGTGFDLHGTRQRTMAFAQNARLHERPCRAVFHRSGSELYELMSCKGGPEAVFN
jgi:hypothetical protein